MKRILFSIILSASPLCAQDFWYRNQQQNIQREIEARETWERGQRFLENQRIQGQLDEIREEQEDWQRESRRRQWNDFDCE